MTLCYQNAIEFPRVRRRVVEARFNAGELTSDGGSLLLRQADRYLGLTDAVARAPDPRRRASCRTTWPVRPRTRSPHAARRRGVADGGGARSSPGQCRHAVPVREPRRAGGGVADT